ncbi:MAG: Gfo/Idh/MocA family oxidoreductase [Planctomycetes bacterium]|nr:Gfo/Idh/MocA family oxidoreductase [Planctomycetota bacterium]
MAARALRMAVVGVGHLGKIHAKIYAENPRAELVAVVDANAEQARGVAEAYGCAALSDASELPADLDGVSVVVPTRFHAAVAVPLLERGVPCLVEKPIAGTLADADAILAAAERGGALLGVGHVERFQPGVRKVRQMGMRPRFIECHRLAPFSFRSMDVGVVHDLMIHDLDLILHLVDSEIESVDAAGGAILTDYEDMASVRLVFANGARANISASRASLEATRRFRLFSSQGYVSLDFQKNYGIYITQGPEWESGREALRTLDPMLLAMRQDWIKERVLSVTELELAGAQRPLQAELDAFLDCIEQGAQPEVSGRDGRRALELAERIAADIRAQEW